MDTPIKNIDDLKVEIARLRNLEIGQSVALKARFSSPSAIFSSALTLFPKSPTADGVKSAGFFKQDFLGLISRIALPLTLNKTLFKNSNFLVKTLVGVLSQKASQYISGDAVGGIWNKARSVFDKLTKKKGHDVDVIPEYSKYYNEPEKYVKEGEKGGYAG